VSFSENPEKLGLPSLQRPHWDPFWSACADEGTIVCLHFGSGRGMVFPTLDAPMDAVITLMPIAMADCAADLLWSPVLRKFKQIKFALSEAGIGWIPFFLERIDYVYRQHRAWTHQDFGDRLPSEVFREHVVTCFITDRAGLHARHAVGVGGITWECDYPHSDSTWPRSPEALWAELAGIPDAEIDQITHQNALKHFRFDPFRFIPRERASVAALRAQAAHVDLTPRSRGGLAPEREAGIVTAGRVAKQLATALTTRV
jgi:predicted TIM-barrel fold metal-dependent hydrolase